MPHLVLGALPPSKTSFYCAFYHSCLSFTCTTDENAAAQGHTSSLASVDPHGQWFYQSSFLKRYIIRQPGSLKVSHKGRKCRRMKARAAMLCKCLQRSESYIAVVGQPVTRWICRERTVTCSRSWHCVCSIGKGSRHQGVWHRRRWSERGCICRF